ncbi:hypothetical protein RRG08_022413 [Elysia crispata]|uniref:Uncharacterized protein n=1 Tax=Elysia crispata TaxID=231223 RepID=A0AAE0Z2M6_9GAST|nr:hypothetical protein RRG08_022413 [Elysia crispata]
MNDVIGIRYYQIWDGLSQHERCFPGYHITNSEMVSASMIGIFRNTILPTLVWSQPTLMVLSGKPYCKLRDSLSQHEQCFPGYYEQIRDGLGQHEWCYPGYHIANYGMFSATMNGSVRDAILSTLRGPQPA